MSLEELDLNQENDTPMDDVEVPETDDMGPAVLGKQPLIGSVRRSKGLPVARDEIKKEFDL